MAEEATNRAERDRMAENFMLAVVMMICLVMVLLMFVRSKEQRGSSNS